MSKQVTARMVQEGVGFKLIRPRENYEDAAFAVWYLMRETGRNDEAPASDFGGRDGYHVTGMGLVQCIALLWPKLSDSESAAALTAIRKHLQKNQAAQVIVSGRNHRPSEWWVAATWAREEDTDSSAPVEAPTDWTPKPPVEDDEGTAINGKVIQLPEREPGDSIADRVTKATEIIDSVILELQDQVNGLNEEIRNLRKSNSDLEAENKVLRSRFEAASHALHDDGATP